MGRRSAVGQAFWHLPEPVRTALFRRRNGYSADDVPPPPAAPDAATRLLIGPANSAGQGWAWARAAERLAGVGAVDVQVRGDGDFGYPADITVPSGVAAHSPAWARAQWNAVSRDFTHVLAESQLPLFGARFRGDVVAERRALAAAGVRVASVCHGSDIRSPALHREHEIDSPFHDRDLELTRSLERSVERRTAILDDLAGREFVSTPDLLLDRPAATWLPVVIDPDQWASPHDPLHGVGSPVVVHAPSLAGLKGTQLIMPTVERARDAGLIDLRSPSRLPAAQMASLIRDADIVLDQFSLGIYGVAACEAMAAGRIVVSHVSDVVRRTVRAETGWDLPIVEARAGELMTVLADIRDRPAHYREFAARGPAFVAEVHDGRRSAATMASFLTGAADPGASA